jgi:hypothetical protein
VNRLKIVIVGFLYWLVFGVGTILTIIKQFFGIIKYAITGDEKERDWVTRTGQGLDGVCNADYFDGDPRETISSHTGRWVESGEPIPPKFKFVNWLTGLFQPNHAVRSIEEPFRGTPK